MSNSHFQNDLKARLHQGLSRIPPNWSLCLLDGKKVPQGIGWQQNPLTPEQMKTAIIQGWKVDKADGTQYQCYPKGYGLITGTPVELEGNIYYLMALDQDGASARAKILELSGGESLPATVAFTSGRPGRCQYLFLVPQQYAQSLRTRKFPTVVRGDDGKDEQLELRWVGLQSVLPPSVHPTTGEYVWVSGCAPDEIAIAIAPLWLIEAMLQEETEPATAAKPYPLHNEVNIYYSPTSNNSQLQWTDADWALSYLAALSPSRADHYEDWCTVGMILKSIDESLLHEWESWSRQSSKYKPGECDKKWKSFNKSGVGIGTLALMAKQDGWSSPFRGQSLFNGSHTFHLNSPQIIRTENGHNNHNSMSDASNHSGDRTLNNTPSLYDQVTTILTSDNNPPQQSAAFVELSSAKGYPLRGVKQLAVEIETYIGNQERRTEDARELNKLLNYRQQKLNITQILPAPLAQALLTKADSDRLDPAYLYQYLLTACGSEMGGHIGIVGKQGATVADSWIEYPIFWTMVIALASGGKSQTMRSIFDPIKHRYRQSKTEYKKLKTELQGLEEAWQQKSSEEKEELKNSQLNPTVFKATMPPPPPKKLIEAGTPEGALRRLSELASRSGCVWVFDELVRLLKLDQYKDKGGDTRQILLQTWNSPSDLEFERSNEEDSFELKDLCLNLTGATQLSKIKTLFSDPDDGDGLISRFLIAVPASPDNFAVWSDSVVAINQELQDLYEHLRVLHQRLREFCKGRNKENESLIGRDEAVAMQEDGDLFSTSSDDSHEEQLPFLLSFTPQARRRWQRWWEEVRRNQQGVEFENPALFAYLGKMLSQTLRLALLLHCMELKYEQKSDPLRVGIETLERAILAAKFSIGQFRIIQTNNHQSDSLPGRLSSIHAYALRKGTEVSAVQVQNTVFKRCKPKPTLAEIRQDFATLTENGYAVLSGKGKDLRIRAIPISQANVGIPNHSDCYSDTPQVNEKPNGSSIQPSLVKNSDNSDPKTFFSTQLENNSSQLGDEETSKVIPVAESSLSELGERLFDQNCRNCRNSDDESSPDLYEQGILDDERLSETCRNDVGISDNLLEENSDSVENLQHRVDPDSGFEPNGT
ncbi:DUF3987 domain-containing protein [Planktothrix pseudagardhii]|uniref:DNA primase/polymerase bifunctional N-terminal domain-containing protein n=1 Tax=Planktothrix pseudagardhii TaxID=132604 RepID=A0A9W4G3Q6_9CYAN|nr:DUF3987 domain-containing protein [Planktothrix pseudagardhii]CAD5928691.1 hypothetical protein NO713_01144 [Planktothrix pseudagardhii]